MHTLFRGSVQDLQRRLAAEHYVADHGLTVSLFLAIRLGRPLWLEGEAGVGKTALAGAVASALGTDLIRLQCYEGLDLTHAVYEWDYARQLVELRILEASGELDLASTRRELYSDAFLIKRPLLQAIDPARAHPAVLLIDEIDRTDEEFEGYLLELLAEFQITIPELGTVRAAEPLVLLCDVSGSMDRYSRMLLHFARALEHRHRRVEVFLFATRLTRVTGALRVHGLDRALAEASRSVPDWSGGTRIGESLRQLHQRWRRRAVRGDSVVLLVSDGWDRGDPALLADQIGRLRRSCHRLIRLDPLIDTVDYAPLTRGLQAALPFVDDFLPARTLANLADLALHLNALAERN